MPLNPKMRDPFASQSLSSGDGWFLDFECYVLQMTGPPTLSYQGFLPFIADQPPLTALLAAAVRTFFSSSMVGKQHYRDFEPRTLRPNEDPSLFLWDLRQYLERWTLHSAPMIMTP